MAPNSRSSDAWNFISKSHYMSWVFLVSWYSWFLGKMCSRLRVWYCLWLPVPLVQECSAQGWRGTNVRFWSRNWNKYSIYYNCNSKERYYYLNINIKYKYMYIILYNPEDRVKKAEITKFIWNQLFYNYPFFTNEKLLEREFHVSKSTVWFQQ